MKRSLERHLQSWRSRIGRKPLLLHGLRQCGKTHLLTTWGAKTFPRTHYVNFEQLLSAHQIFARDLAPQRILDELGFLLGTAIRLTDLLILDEIQACPRALTSLKYFDEQMPELAVATAGSV